MTLPIDSSERGHAASINVYQRTYSGRWQWSVWSHGAGTVGTASSEAEAWRLARAAAAQTNVVDPTRRIIP